MKTSGSNRALLFFAFQLYSIMKGVGSYDKIIKDLGINSTVCYSGGILTRNYTGLYGRYNMR